MAESGGEIDEAVSGRIDDLAAAPAPNGLVVADAAGEAATGGNGGVEAERGIGLPSGVVTPALGGALISEPASMGLADGDGGKPALGRISPTPCSPALRRAVVSQPARCVAPADGDGRKAPSGGTSGVGAADAVAPALEGAVVSEPASMGLSNGDGGETPLRWIHAGLVVVLPAIGSTVVSNPARVAASRGDGGEVAAEVDGPSGVVPAGPPALDSAVFADATRMVLASGHRGEAFPRGGGFLNGAGCQQACDHHDGQR